MTPIWQINYISGQRDIHDAYQIELNRKSSPDEGGDIRLMFVKLNSVSNTKADGLTVST